MGWPRTTQVGEMDTAWIAPVPIVELSKGDIKVSKGLEKLFTLMM